jgi:hypothetical protein
MDTGPVAMMEAVGATIEQAMLGAGGHKFEIAEGNLAESRVVIGEKNLGG